MQPRTTLLPLLESCFRDLVESSDAAPPANSTALVEALAHFALMERGVLRPGSRLAQQALRTGRLSLARRLIEQNLSRAALSPTLIADMLGISVRHMHVLFEATAMSFSQTVATLRIDRSRRLLRETPGRPIAEIAFASGFESLATFYRAFNAVEGMSPGDLSGDPARRAQHGLARRSMSAAILRNAPASSGAATRQVPLQPRPCDSASHLTGK
ncbi:MULTISPECIES: AraC family transcriptional regulator [unclassified Bradyrhizobium]|uniref:AraC family transcriptional regulator n=1 Tax=unclassified Bradyrhizobium TaxID=2631580 RepID=UPI00247975AB|nr:MULTISPECIES: AraC family transcriptional regulator [unclassified Bradyrhizobium]WGS17537.1 helix-turn-helix domain-containing protein [Bradyrhizobium sp. ISRA463]WGS24320.1 helix-turn-helix domain-containing protein [Bradyrhizobium sp. ISRA464]